MLSRKRKILKLASVFGLFFGLLALALGAAQPGKDRGDPNWPCRQILVAQLSPASVWSGPSIEAVKWRDDPAVAALAGKLAARRNPIGDAEAAITGFAHGLHENKKEKLTALFAGVFEILNEERSQVIEGLLRFGARQKELAEKIRSENSSLHGGPGENTGEDKQPPKPQAADLQWDLRLFEERQQSITYACETPTLIEQRLYTLTKAIEQQLS